MEFFTRFPKIYIVKKSEKKEKNKSRLLSKHESTSFLYSKFHPFDQIQDGGVTDICIWSICLIR